MLLYEKCVWRVTRQPFPSWYVTSSISEPVSLHFCRCLNAVQPQQWETEPTNHNRPKEADFIGLLSCLRSCWFYSAPTIMASKGHNNNAIGKTWIRFSPRLLSVASELPKKMLNPVSPGSCFPASHSLALLVHPPSWSRSLCSALLLSSSLSLLCSCVGCQAQGISALLCLSTFSVVLDSTLLTYTSSLLAPIYLFLLPPLCLRLLVRWRGGVLHW